MKQRFKEWVLGLFESELRKRNRALLGEIASLLIRIHALEARPLSRREGLQRDTALRAAVHQAEIELSALFGRHES